MVDDKEFMDITNQILHIKKKYIYLDGNFDEN